MTSVSFTEEMKGHVAFGEEDFHQGERLGREQGTELMFHLTIETDDFDRFRADTSHPAVPRGWIGCEALGGRLAVEGGLSTSRSIIPTEASGCSTACTSATEPGTRSRSTGSRWCATIAAWISGRTPPRSTPRLLSGHVDAREDAEAARVASGVVRILPLDFARQLTTFRARGGSAGRRGRALAGFAGLFIGDLFKVYGSRASEAAPAMPGGDGAGPTEARPRPGSGRPRPARPGDHLEHRLVPFEAGDGMALDLVHVVGAGPPRKGPVLLIHGAGVRPTSFARRPPPPSSSVWSPRATTSGSRTGARRSTTSRTAGRSTRRRRWTTPGRSRRSSPKPAPRR